MGERSERRIGFNEHEDEEIALTETSPQSEKPAVDLQPEAASAPSSEEKVPVPAMEAQPPEEIASTPTREAAPVPVPDPEPPPALSSDPSLDPAPTAQATPAPEPAPTLPFDAKPAAEPTTAEKVAAALKARGEGRRAVALFGHREPGLRRPARPAARSDPQAGHRYLRHSHRQNHGAVPGLRRPAARQRHGCGRRIHLHRGAADPHQEQDAAAARARRP